MSFMRIYFTTIGVLCLILAIWLCVRRLRAQFCGARAIGTITGYQARESEDSIFNLPVVTFVDAAGVQHKFVSVAGSTAKAPALGMTVTVRIFHLIPPSSTYRVFCTCGPHLLPWASWAQRVLRRDGCLREVDLTYKGY